jgi:hypothetical protein
MLYVKNNLYYKRRYDLELSRVVNMDRTLENNTHVIFGLFYPPPNVNTHYTSDIEDSIALAVNSIIDTIIVTG